MHNSGSVGGGHKLGAKNAPRIGLILGLVGKVVPEAFISHANQVTAEHGGRHRSLHLCRVSEAKLFGVGTRQVFGNQECRLSSRRSRRIETREAECGPSGHNHIRNCRPHGERRIRGQCPGRGGPGECLHSPEPKGIGAFSHQRECDRDRLVLTHLVDVVIHSQFVIAQRRLVAPAVGQHTVSLVRETLVVQLLERPDGALHEGDIEGLVVVIKVDPARLARDVFLPLLRVLEHRLSGHLVKGGNAHLFDLALVGDAQLALGFEFGGQTVGVPPESALHALAAHGLVAREEVFGVARQKVTVVGQAVGKRRTVVEHPLFGVLLGALRDGGAKRVICLPEGEHLLFDGGK